MRVVPINELYGLLKKEHNKSLWSFLESVENNNFLTETERKNYFNWINKVNRNHHQESHFFDNLKNIFKEDNTSHLILGQEDLGAIAFKNAAIIVRHAEMGVAFTLTKTDSNPINEDDWKNYQHILSALDLGFINAKDFHLLKSFDKINNELKIKDSAKEHKVKI